MKFDKLKEKIHEYHRLKSKAEVEAYDQEARKLWSRYENTTSRPV